MNLLAETLLGGVLVGAIYSLVAAGLSLIRGVMGLVNFAQGEFMVLGMYLSYWAYTLWGVDPLVSLLAVALVLFAVGFLVYQILIERVIVGPPIAQILATFGLSIFLANLALFVWGPEYRAISGSMASGTTTLLGVPLSVAKLIAGLGSALVCALLYAFLKYTRFGKAVQATSMNRTSATLMGINTNRINAVTFGIGAACAGIAGALISNFYYVYPGVGSVFINMAFVAMIIGGVGNVVGAFFGGLIIGVIELLASVYVDPVLKYPIIFGIYFLVIFCKPKGVFVR